MINTTSLLVGAILHVALLVNGACNAQPSGGQQPSPTRQTQSSNTNSMSSKNSPASSDTHAPADAANSGQAATPAANASDVSGAASGAEAARGQIEGVEFTATARVVTAADGNKRLVINYTVRNGSKFPLLLFNRGDTSNSGRSAVYVEPQTDGTVEISQRGFLPPGEPSPTRLIYPGASVLGPGKSTSDKVELSLRLLVRRHPYASQSPALAQMPDPVRKVRFCLGAALQQEGIQTRTVGRGREKVIVPDIHGLAAQRLLCSPTTELDQAETQPRAPRSE